MLPTDPQSAAQSDASDLDAIYERNKKRIAEIEAAINEIQPVVMRLLMERDACYAVCRRSTPVTITYGSGSVNAGSPTPRSVNEVGERTAKNA